MERDRSRMEGWVSRFVSGIQHVSDHGGQQASKVSKWCLWEGERGERREMRVGGMNQQRRNTAHIHYCAAG